MCLCALVQPFVLILFGLSERLLSGSKPLKKYLVHVHSENFTLKMLLLFLVCKL